MHIVGQFFRKPWLYLTIVLIGTSLKFYQLNSKLFWRDEVSTVLYTTGVKESVILESIPVNQILSIGFYDSLLHPNRGEYNLTDEVTGILADTHLTPAHYIFLSFWDRLAGDTDMDYRRFSVLVFILTLPFFFFLAKTLFNSNIAGWIACSFFAVSPFIHFEAQEARYYALWVLFFVSSNYFFVRAIRSQQPYWWVAYTVSCVLALYTSALSGLYLLGHFIFVWLLKKPFRGGYVFSLLFIVLAFLPRLYFLYQVRDTLSNGLSWHISDHASFFTLELLFMQLIGLVRFFSFLYDMLLYFSLLMTGETAGISTGLWIDAVLLCVIVYAIYFLLTKTTKERKWFLILLLLPTILFFYLSDIFRQGFTSILWRYQIVNMVVVGLVMTNLLQEKIRNGKMPYAVLYLGLITMGLVSIFKISEIRCWNTSPDCTSNVEEARYISTAEHPLLITDFNKFGLANFLAVINDARLTNADVVYCKGNVPDIKSPAEANGYTDVYVIHASDSLAAAVQAQFGGRLLPFRKEVPLWSSQIWHAKLK